MNNDSKIKFTSFNIILAIFLSLILHLIFFTKFNLFDLLNTIDNYETNELEIFVTPEEKKGNNEKKSEKLIKSDDNLINLNKNQPSKKEKEIPPELDKTTQKNDHKIESSSDKKIEERKKTLDKNKILSNVSKLSLNNAPIPNEKIRIKNISAKSPEYVYRLYFEAWKKKVERMGAMNYPDAAKIKNRFSNLIMKVIINSNGSIYDISIIKSSGKAKLDEAAIDIVRNGSPYAPFSDQMKKEVDQVSITRIWKFTEDKSF
jgi:TonB family protein